MSFLASLIRHGVILSDAAADVGPADTARWLIGQSGRIAQGRYCEVVATLPDVPPLWPAGNPLSLPVRAFSPEWRNLAEGGVTLLCDGDRPWVGLIDPGQTSSVLSVMHAQFGMVPELRLLTPHFFAHLLSLDAPALVDPPALDPVACSAWLTELDLAPPTDQSDLSAWRERLAHDIHESWDVDLLPDGWSTSPAPMSRVPEAVVLFRSPTIAWIGSTQAHRPSVVSRAQAELGVRIVPCMVTPAEWSRLTDRLVSSSDAAATLSAPASVQRWSYDPDAPPDVIGQQLYSEMMRKAVADGASDVHLEPEEESVGVRFRVLGHLVPQPPVSHDVYPALLRRIKIQAGMKQSESGVPQTGAAELRLASGTTLDLRVEVGVVRSGSDNCVIRLLSRRLPTLDQLSLMPEARLTLDRFLKRESGLCIVAGPTGSGKTTALYACLQQVNTPERKIITFENPPEKLLPRATQYAVSADGNISFDSCMATAMRQDPDIIMIGEIRDRPSAAAAFQAALSGHLVLTTLHASDSVAVFERLRVSFGVDPATIADCLSLVVSIRLVRRLCPHCRVVRPATAHDLKPLPEVHIPNPVIAHALGCPACAGTGSSGRFAICELVEVDDGLSALVLGQGGKREMRHYLHGTGFEPLSVIATRLALTGEIALDEALRFPRFRR